LFRKILTFLMKFSIYRCDSYSIKGVPLLGPLFTTNIGKQMDFVVYFLLGDSPASEFYTPTFRNTLFHLHRQIGACRMNWAGDMFGVLEGKRLGSEMA